MRVWSLPEILSVYYQVLLLSYSSVESLTQKREENNENSYLLLTIRPIIGVTITKINSDRPPISPKSVKLSYTCLSWTVMVVSS